MAFVSPFHLGASCPRSSWIACCPVSHRHSPGVHAARRLQARRQVSMIDGMQPVFKIKNEAAHNAWVKAYKAYLARSGEQACRMAMDGFDKLGRGAVFVLDKPGVNVGVATATGIEEGIMSMYVTLTDMEQKSTAQKTELEPILSRMRLYDPTRQFCVVYETGGMQGADIVTPKRMPRPSVSSP